MPRVPSRRITFGGDSRSDGRVRLIFEVPPERPGWPPVDREAIWGVEVARNSYRIDNTPFFVKNLAVGDIVAATSKRGLLQAGERLTWGGHRTIRVRPRPDADLDGGLDAVFDLFTPLGVQGEGDALHGVAALCVPGDAELGPIISLLDDGTERGWWDYEEACVDQAWVDAAGRS